MANVIKGYVFTGATQSFLVPDQVTELIIECWGAWGFGESTTSHQAMYSGGPPQYVKGTINVTPGDVYIVSVGGSPLDTDAQTGGWNGGGNGGDSGTANSANFQFGAAGGGGGATDIRFGGSALANRILVAAGGGGAGSVGAESFIDSGIFFPTSPYPPYASDPIWQQYEVNTATDFEGAGGASGASGQVGETSLKGQGGSNAVSDGSGGGGATTGAGGAAGTNSTGTAMTAPTAGASGVGGNGGGWTGAGSTGAAGGGGGGGGYFGGGGGGATYGGITNGAFGSGGGGGSGFASVDFASVIMSDATPRGITSTNLPAYSQLGHGGCAISYIQPPEIPTVSVLTADNTGTAGSFDASKPLTVGWAFRSLVLNEWETRSDVRFSSDGGSTWTVISVADSGPNISDPSHEHTFPANFFSAGSTYDVQVRVYDKENDVSGWSASASFTAVALLDAPTITAPTEGSNITSETFTISWTIPSGTQTDYQVEVVLDDGTVLVNTGDVSSATESYNTTVAFVEAQNVTISVRYKTSAGGALWSTIETVVAFLNVDPPNAATVNVGTDAASGAISLDIANSASGTAAIYNDIYRTDITNGTDEIQIASQYPVNTVFVDHTPGSGIYYQYRVRAISAAGGVADTT